MAVVSDSTLDAAAVAKQAMDAPGTIAANAAAFLPSHRALASSHGKAQAGEHCPQGTFSQTGCLSVFVARAAQLAADSGASRVTSVGTPRPP